MSKFEEIRLILLRNWDPIGVAGFSSYNEATEDEYNGYARALEKLMSDGADESNVLDYLKWAEEINMGLSFEQGRAVTVAALIMAAR